MKTYYGLLKSGEIRQYENPPKRKHLTLKTDWMGVQDTAHMLECNGVHKTFMAHCGYDRGPRLDRLITKMLTA